MKEGPEEEHIAIEPEGDVHLNHNQDQEYDGLTVCSCFKRRLIDILWQLTLKDADEMCSLFADLFHHLTRLSNEELRLLDLDLGLLQPVLRYGYRIIEIQLYRYIIRRPSNNTMIKICSLSISAANGDGKDIIFTGEYSLWFLAESGWNLQLLIELDVDEAASGNLVELEDDWKIWYLAWLTSVVLWYECEIILWNEWLWLGLGFWHERLEMRRRVTRTNTFVDQRHCFGLVGGVGLLFGRRFICHLCRHVDRR